MRRIFLLSILLSCMTIAAKAVPAYRGAITATQPDGTTITFFIRGDEHSHETVSIDGYMLMQDEQGAYRYVQQADNQTLTIEGLPIAHNPQQRTTEENIFLNSIKRAVEIEKPYIKAFSNIEQNGIKRTKKKASSTSASRFQIGTFPTYGNAKCLVLLVQFSDTSFSLDKDFHDRLLNEEGYSENGATGSAKDYYFAQSMGVFNPHFDVVGPITLSHNVSYYGNDDALYGTDPNAGIMIEEACNIAHSDFGVDFSQYDGDDDGNVDMVYVIYAGYGQHAGGGSNTIWPHKYQLSGYGITLELDNKNIDVYACSSELYGNSGTQSSGIGTICHEFGHVLGLADHYNTSNSTDYKLGKYDIMDYGSYNNDGNTPPSYNAFERMTLGWLTPKELDEPTDGITLYNISDYNEAYILNTSSEDEFYLLENRQQSGWDSYIEGTGMMITHIDYSEQEWNNNTVNDTDGHPRFHIVPADNETGYDIVLNKYTEKYDLYPATIPGKGTNDSFTDVSTPAASPWTGETLDKWITGITIENDGSVSFDYMSNHLKTPTELSATVMSDNSFKATWEETEKATSYTVNLYKLDYRSAQKEALKEDFSLMTAGTSDSPSSTDISGSLDNYTTEKGWSGSKVYQAGGWCQIGSSTSAGSLTTPELNLKRYDGEFTVAVNVKSVSGKQPVFNVTANGMTGKTRITSTARTYLFKFTCGISKTAVTFSTNTERAIIDSITIVRGDGTELFPDAKEISVSGTQEITEGDVEDTDFIHTDTLTVEGIAEPSYVFNDLEANAYYSFSVKAKNENAESAWSEEVTVYTNYAADIDNATVNSYDNEKTEIYTIDGIRTSSMNGKGIYIIKRGKKTIKAINK